MRIGSPVQLVILALVIQGAMSMSFPPARSQTDPEQARISDPLGDVHVEGAFPSQEDQEQFPEADLLAVWIGPENETAVEFGVQFKAVSKNVGAVRDTRVYFTNANESFLLRITTRFGTPTTHHARLAQERDDESFYTIASPPLVEDATTNSLRVSVPRFLLLDEYNIPLRFGSELSSFYAETRVPLPADEVAAARDRAPDDGFGAPFVSKHLEPDSFGDLFLQANMPVRASNGEATTIVFSTVLANRGNHERLALFSVDNAPEDWIVRTPTRVSMPAKTSVTVPVVLVLESTHVHGLTQYFAVRAESQEDRSHWASVRLGVEWLTYPQPAGHHPRLYAHSAPVPPEFTGEPSRLAIWINANATGTDPQAMEDDAPWYADGEFQTPGKFVARWRLPLNPLLRIGLAFDLSLEGGLHARITPATDSATAQVHAAIIYYCGKFDAVNSGRECPNRPRILATGTSPVVATSGSTDFDVSLTVASAFQNTPYLRGANVGLEILFSTENPQSLPVGAEPHPALVVAETNFWLPFLEYHDPIEPAFQNVGMVKVSVAGSADREVNPGRETVIHLVLRNEGQTSQSLSLDLEGTNKAWAQVSASKLQLAPRESSDVSVRIRAPETAAARESAELIFIAQSDEDANVMALTRIRATVVDPAVRVIPNDGSGGGENGRTPGLSFVEMLGVAALLVGSLARRFRFQAR